MEKKRFNLSFLRVLACLGVFMTHIGQLIPVSGIVGNIVSFGKYGVYVFFILSGMLGIESYTKYQKPGTYYINRAKRLLPIYFTVIIWYMFFYNCLLTDYVIPVDPYKLGWLRYFLFINFCIPGDEFWMNLGAVWTISCFVLFYLLVPIYYKYIHDTKKCILNLILCLLLNFLMPNCWFQTACLLYWFVLGMVIHFSIKEKKHMGVILYSSIMIIAMLVIERYEGPMIYGHVFSIIIVALDSFADFDFVPCTIKKFISILDEYSYCIYLCHPVVIAIIKNLFCAWYENVETGWKVILVYIIGTAGIAGICHNVIEKPLYNIGRQKCVN